MAQVNVEVNGRPYAVGCEDGQETHLQDLAKLFDQQVRQISQDMGQLGDTRLFLMGGLLLADELLDARNRLAALQVEVGRLQADRARVETKAVSALEAAASKIEKLAAEGA
ncbi:MAG: cell division protein ZapA [Phenylobacterium sp. RIFCSPHIGHO2_01_FULL_69_31]|jgi:cell division protein ZapA|uniref:cell division protein ZapA n=1 Tax=Phenylobacterium sp. RIFCSPHIGHO2_01_FULL_69_31 TaxID=1801944 RepID=UPI0008AFD015|nr:cell division protein ZapA [Phenylobacterium sp. RIFCSPHIGHO2_01_FULL_69_31]OHB27499.1 MAG: cell division protein ZapA [Phenylobacterium sp. RIFCSPHIGHO2_01_FULL_69_31]